MANPTPLPRPTKLERLTVANIKTFVARALGIDSAEFTTDEDSIMLDLINRETNEWRHLVQNTKPIGQEELEYEWGGIEAHDPASGDNQVELPANFAELQDDTIWYVNDEGNPETRIPIIDAQTFRETFYDGTNYLYTEATPVAFIYQESDNSQRILHVYPTPDDGVKLVVPYYAYANQVTGDSSIIEASADVHDGIRYGVAARWAELDGDDAAVVRWASRRQSKWSLYSNRAGSRWVKPFDGYPGLTDTPDRQFVNRRNF
jgi:hypothetical protein